MKDKGEFVVRYEKLSTLKQKANLFTFEYHLGGLNGQTAALVLPGVKL